MKKNKKVILALMLLVALIICVLCYFLIDKKQFTNEKNNMKNYMSVLKKDNIKIKDETVQEYCSYGHQKYNKGSLGCEVSITFSIDNTVDSQAIERRTPTLGWSYRGDNTRSLNEYSDIKYIKHEVFSHNKLDCFLSSTGKNESTVYELSCYGPAKAEWFSVR